MTRYFVIFLIVLVVLYDVLIICYAGGDASISTCVRQWAQEYPIVTFAIGVIIGHLLWKD